MSFRFQSVVTFSYIVHAFDVLHDLFHVENFTCDGRVPAQYNKKTASLREDKGFVSEIRQKLYQGVDGIRFFVNGSKNRWVLEKKARKK